MLNTWHEYLAITAPWIAPKWEFIGAPVSPLELTAVLLGLWMVWGNYKVRLWAWPLAFASSALYALLFVHYKLYGEAGLQLLFMLMAVWGAWQWLYGKTNLSSFHGNSMQPLPIRKLSDAQRWLAVLAIATLWPLLGLLLDHTTDSDVPYWDALPTAGSVVGQFLLGRKWVDNWPCWLVVNVISTALFAYKGLWLTAILYAIFALLAVMGWLHWRKLMIQPSTT